MDCYLVHQADPCGDGENQKKPKEEQDNAVHCGEKHATAEKQVLRPFLYVSNVELADLNPYSGLRSA